MKKSLFSILVISGGVLFSGCSYTASTQQTNSVPSAASQAEEKKGDTTLTGSVTEANGVFYISQPGQPTQEIESYSVELSQYVGQTVTVTGQFSGDTLFVGSIE